MNLLTSVVLELFHGWYLLLNIIVIFLFGCKVIDNLIKFRLRKGEREKALRQPVIEIEGLPEGLADFFEYYYYFYKSEK